MKKHKKWLSICLVICLIAGTGGALWYRQHKIEERKTVPDLYSQGRGRDKRFLESTDPRSQNGSKGIQCRYRHSGTVRGE